MFDLIQQGLAVQQKICNANKRALLTHEEVIAIKAEGKVIVHKPTELERGKCEKHGEFSKRYHLFCPHCYSNDKDESNETSQAENDKLENSLFDRAEAHAINRAY